MSYRYFVIADEDTLSGFRCAGIPGRAVGNSREAAEALSEACKKNAGVVIVTEEISAMIKPEIDAVRFSEELPMVVEIPGPQGPMPGHRTLSDIIREAIGVKV